MKLGIRARVLLALGLLLAALGGVGAISWRGADATNAHLDAARRDVAVLVAFALIAGAVSAASIIRDLNRRERKRKGLAANGALLRDAYDELRDLYDNAPCGYHSIDADGTVVRMNDTELGWLGYTREEVVGRMHVSELVMPSDRPDTKRRLEEFSRTDRIDEAQVQYRRKDGTPLAALMSATAVRGMNGHFVMTRTSVTDITELWHSQQELETVVGELEKAMASIRTLTGLLPMCSMCHKIRDDQGYWERIESYVSQHTDARVSHGVCPDCFPKMFPGIDLEELEGAEEEGTPVR